MSSSSSLLLACFVVVLAAFACVSLAAPEPVLKHHWNHVNFTWRTKEEYHDWIKKDGYRSCFPAGIRVSHSKQTFVSFPRWNPYIPATMTRLVEDKDGNALFEPYPSWEMNKEGDINALQSVLGFEIDGQDRLWILDQGRVEGQAALPGSIKLVVWDIPSNRLVFSYSFPEYVAPLNTSFMNDLVLDFQRHRVYMTDSGLPLDAISDEKTYGGLVVFDIDNKKSWRVLHMAKTTVADPTLWININDHMVNPNIPMRTGADGIALTADLKTLYFLPLTSHALYSISTDLLADPSTPDNVLRNAVVTVTPDRGSASDGLSCDNKNNLYLTSLEGNGVLRMTPDGVFEQLTQNPANMRWPDTVGYDHSGNIVYLTNSLYLFVAKTIDWSYPYNFCIWSYETGTDSYLDV